MRERYDVDGDNRAAIVYGLEKTAGVITGAAAIMAAAFATAPIATVSQMGVGLTVAICSTRPWSGVALLPALMLLLGDRVWHVPPALDRILPRRSVLAARAGTGPARLGGRCRRARRSPARRHPAAAEAPTRAEYVDQLEAV